MKILVCVKQVPERESRFRLDPSGKGYSDQGINFVLNPYDEYALEEALLIRERLGQVEITALSLGPARVEKIIRRALELGADHGAHILTPESYYLGPGETALQIVKFTRERGFDLLFFGIISEDYMRGQTGPMVAALLQLPFATAVVSETISDDLGLITVERELEAGAREVVELPLPAVLTIQSGINRPRYPRLTDKLRARAQKLEVITGLEPLPPGRCAELLRAFFPPPSPAGTFITGALEEQAEKLIRIIREKTDVL
ncbi:MAG: electron transfer flavoprotein subunit beta/FixA family protein [Proteobacteria bacterium]|jgi:electron transfer flavoprotein beta subunit|nr:electron transfer flavoprotein subunit beta/FixA family protein [Pseudomonadota bacterium]